MATVAEQVQQIYIGLLGRAAEKTGLDYWVDQVTTGALTLDQVRANFVSSQDEYITNIGSLPREGAVNALYQNLFARDAEAEGLAYWTTGAGQNVPFDELVSALINGAALTDAGALENKVEVAQYYTDATANGLAYDDATAASVIANVTADDQTVAAGKALVDGGTANGEAISLTTSQDNLTGTAGADVFNAYIFDNNNTAQSGDRIDGGTGTDTLFADIGNSQDFAITLNTESVEKFQVRAEVANNNDTTDNNLARDVQIDAERMEGTNWYETNNSRADVIIEDVRIERKDAYGDDTDQITRDITIAMVSTDPGNVDLGVYFDQHSLVKAGDAISNSITLNVANQLETALGYDAATPLLNIPYDQVSFVVNGTTVTLNIDLTDVETYADFYVKLQDAFANEKQVNPALLDVNLTRTLLTEDFIAKDGENRQADEYILTTENGTIEPATVGWNASAGLPSNNAFSASVLQGDISTTSNLITSTIYLDDVGRGSMGGDLVVGGLSIGDTSNSKGVEQFDITVERSSQLQEIQSTNNTLEEVYIKNGAVKGDLVVAGDTNGDNDLPGVEGNAGFTDVRVVDASAMEGKVSINAELTGSVVAKYLNSTDNASDASADNVDFLYKLGSNNDTLDLTISNANLAAAGTGSREDFILNIDGNGGDDNITTIIGNGAGISTDAWYINQKDNANLNIDAGAGNDTVTTTGAGDFKIDAGAGNDTVYANNDGNNGSSTSASEVQTITVTTAGTAGDIVNVGGVSVTLAGATATDAAAIANALNGNAAFAAEAFATLAGSTVTITYNDTENKEAISVLNGASTLATTIATVNEGGATAAPTGATWASNTTGGAGLNIDDLIGNGAGTKNVMEGLKLTVTFSGAQTTGSSGVISAAAVANTLGFESTVTISTADKLGDNNTINQAIKKAINEDAVLSKLLVATDGPADSLVIKSLVDGTFAADDLAITLAAPTLTEITAWSATEQTAVGTAVNDLANTSGAAITPAAIKTALDAAVTAQTTAGALDDLALATKDGTDIVGTASTSTSDNTITLGTGDDVAVLGTEGNSNDTLVLSGIFGNDTIYNFTDAVGADQDFLSVDAYLGGQTSVSGSTASAVEIANTSAITGVAGNSLLADEVEIINDFVGTATETWASLTASELLAAIKATNVAGADDYANIVETTLDVTNQVANFVGNIQKNVVFIENDTNQGEYKVFELTSDATTDEFTAVTLVGTIDVGASITDATAII